MEILLSEVRHAKVSRRPKMIFHPDNLPMDKGPQGSPVLGGLDLKLLEFLYFNCGKCKCEPTTNWILFRHLVNHSDMFWWPSTIEIQTLTEEI